MGKNLRQWLSNIEEKFPGYLMYIGHHSLDPHETVLYALYRK